MARCGSCGKEGVTLVRAYVRGGFACPECAKAAEEWMRSMAKESIENRRREEKFQTQQTKKEAPR